MLLVPQGRKVGRGGARAGFVATDSIRKGKSRVILDKIVKDATIFDAWSDVPWVVDGTGVRVSLVCFGEKETELVH